MQLGVLQLVLCVCVCYNVCACILCTPLSNKHCFPCNSYIWLQGVPVSVSLKALNPDQTADSTGCGRVQTCSVTSGEWMPSCRMQLPCVGWYELSACTPDALGAEACSKIKARCSSYLLSVCVLAVSTPLALQNTYVHDVLR